MKFTMLLFYTKINFATTTISMTSFVGISIVLTMKNQLYWLIEHWMQIAMIFLIFDSDTTAPWTTTTKNWWKKIKISYTRNTHDPTEEFGWCCMTWKYIILDFIWYYSYSKLICQSKVIQSFMQRQKIGILQRKFQRKWCRIWKN